MRLKGEADAGELRQNINSRDSNERQGFVMSQSVRLTDQGVAMSGLSRGFHGGRDEDGREELFQLFQGQGDTGWPSSVLPLLQSFFVFHKQKVMGEGQHEAKRFWSSGTLGRCHLCLGDGGRYFGVWRRRAGRGMRTRFPTARATLNA